MSFENLYDMQTKPPRIIREPVDAANTSLSDDGIHFSYELDGKPFKGILIATPTHPCVFISAGMALEMLRRRAKGRYVCLIAVVYAKCN